MDDTAPRLSTAAAIALFILLIVLIGGGVAFLIAARPAPVQITIIPPQPTATDAPTPTPGPIMVYVTGAVSQPEQVIELPANSRVSDALTAVGGTTDQADLTAVNLAGLLRDGDQVHVPVVNEASPAALPTQGGGDQVRINSATQADLEELPGIGPALAARIIAYRDANGPFANINALDAVDGIGPSLLEQLAPLVRFD